MRIAVAGGTGLAGSAVVNELAARNVEAVILTRGAGVDLETGRGLSGRLDGVDAVIETTAIAGANAKSTKRFFTAVARNLQAEAAISGVARIVTLSILGVDKAAGRGYYAAKLAQEAAATKGEVPALILRAAQFHDFARQLMGWTTKGPIALVPRQQIQSVAVETVAKHLVKLAMNPDQPTGAIVELAGPERGHLVDQMVRVRNAAGNSKPKIIGLWLPGKTEAGIRAGSLTAGSETVIDGPGFSDWLAAQAR